MPTLKPGCSTAEVKRWQTFLSAQGLLEGTPGKRFDAQTEAATKTFQQRSGLPATGEVGAETRAAARAGGYEGLDRKFLLGPDRHDDLRFCRPYFLVPLAPLERDPDRLQAHGNDLQSVRERIVQWVTSMAAGGEKAKARPVTDIYVLSHGWHRNFFSGVAAYDRLAARLGLLLRTGRLDPPAPAGIKPSENENFHPLFLNLHWHSDPGEDHWVDKSGRRHKADFLRNAAEVFQRKPQPAHAISGETGSPMQRLLRAKRTNQCTGEPQFVVDFEQLFELFSQMSAPGIDALSNDQINAEIACLTERLDDYILQDDGNAPFADKVSVAWTCYHEAAAQGVLLDQDARPARALTPLQAIQNLGIFLVKTLGIVLVLSLLKFVHWDKVGAWLAGHPHLRWILSVADGVNIWLKHVPLWQTALILGLVSLAVLSIAAMLQQDKDEDAPARGLPVPAVLAWLFLQIACALPAIAYLFVTYPLGALLPLLDRTLGPFRMYGERIGPRGGKNGRIADVLDWDVRPRLAALARLPVKLIRLALAKDSQMHPIVDLVDSNLAFFAMQRCGVETGRQAAEFLADLLADVEPLRGARLHFLGHSFGALVVANSARHLAYKFAEQNNPRRIHSLCLLEGAIASNWFEGESVLTERVDILASIFSGYDTANGYIYPLAMHGKPAAGFVGLCHVADRQAERQGGYATLVRPPDFGPELSPGLPRVLNVDASRLIYEGAAATGGGHDDIFKDDVLYLSWAIAMLPSPVSPSPASAVLPSGTLRYAGPRSPLPDGETKEQEAEIGKS